eukprot:6455924-Prymnesium_polylepis.1
MTDCARMKCRHSHRETAEHKRQIAEDRRDSHSRLSVERTTPHTHLADLTSHPTEYRTPDAHVCAAK